MSMHARTHTRAHTCMRVHTHAHTRACACTHMHTHTHTHTCMRVHTHAHVAPCTGTPCTVVPHEDRWHHAVSGESGLNPQPPPSTKTRGPPSTLLDGGTTDEEVSPGGPSSSGAIIKWPRPAAWRWLRWPPWHCRTAPPGAPSGSSCGCGRRPGPLQRPAAGVE